MSKKIFDNEYTERRNKVLKAIPDNYFKGHYNPKKILNYGTSYSLIISERNNGKSTSMLICILLAWQKFSYPSVWVRRMSESLKSHNIGQMFDKIWTLGIVPNIKKYDGIEFKSGAFRGYWLRKDRKEYDKPFLYTKAINGGETTKGTADYKDVMFIVFDEFLSRDKYLPNEYVLFSNTMYTLIRETYDCCIVLLGNPVSWESPYFREFGIKKVRDIQQGTIKCFVGKNPHTSISVEMCGLTQRNKKADIINDRFFGFENKQLESMKFGTWETPLYPRISLSKIDNLKLITRNVYLQYEDNYICLELYNSDTTDLFILARPYYDIPTDTFGELMIYSVSSMTLYPLKYRQAKILSNDRLLNLILTLYKSDRFFYSDNTTGETVRIFMQEFTLARPRFL